MSKFRFLFSNLVSFNTNIELAQKILPITVQYLDYYDAARRKISAINSKNNSEIEEFDSTKIWGYRTTYSIRKFPGMVQFKDLKEALPVNNYVLEKAREFLVEYGYDVKHLSKIDLGNVFVNQIRPGELHTSHTHPNTLLSGVFYVKVPEAASPIVFEDPRPHAKLLPTDDWISKPNDSNRLDLTFLPKTGDLVIWNSWLPHSVPPAVSNYDGNRISIVFNIIKKLC